MCICVYQINHSPMVSHLDPPGALPMHFRGIICRRKALKSGRLLVCKTQPTDHTKLKPWAHWVPSGFTMASKKIPELNGGLMRKSRTKLNKWSIFQHAMFDDRRLDGRFPWKNKGRSHWISCSPCHL